MKSSLITLALAILMEIISVPMNCAKANEFYRPVSHVLKSPEDAGRRPLPTIDEERHRAEQGDKVAQYKIGVCYVIGCDGVSEDYAQAAQWLRKSADQCYDEAEAELGSLYYNGAGVKKDLGEAKKWIQKVAEQDHWEAQYGLARIFIEEHRDNKDDEEAYFWLLVAGRKEGRIEVREFADMLAVLTKVQERLLTPQQVSVVRKRVEEWKPVPCISSAKPKKFECHSGEREINGHQVIIDCEGKGGINEEWKKNGVDDRQDGPAWMLRDPVTGSIRAEQWFKNGKLDREDGPAHIVYDGLTGQPTLEGWVKEGKTFEPSAGLRSAWINKNKDHLFPLPK